MTPDELDLRRALDARSGTPTPSFRARLSSVLSEGRPEPDRLAALALVAAAVIALSTVGVFTLVRHSSPGPTQGAATTARTSPTATAQPGTHPDYVYLSAASGNVVWALVSGTELYRSKDRGATWQHRSMPRTTSGSFEISFISYDEGWVINSQAMNTTCVYDPVLLWHTIDGGATWQAIGSTGIAIDGCKAGLSFVDSDHGFIAAGFPGHAPVIYSTGDGGRSWRRSTALPDPPGWTTGLGTALTAGNVQRFGDALLVAATGYRPDVAALVYVFRSTDGGSTWAYMASGEEQGNPVVFLSPTHWLQGPWAETTNAGLSWHAAPSDYQQETGAAPQVVFGDELVGYATTHGGIQVTVDGGTHWTYIATPGT